VGYICHPIVLIGSCSQGLGGIYMSSHSPDRELISVIGWDIYVVP